MRSEGVKCSASPDVFLKEFSDDKALEEVLRTTMDPDKETKYKKWKRVQTGDKYRWKEMEEIVDKDTFIFTFMDELAAIRKHAEQIQNQYAEMRRLRQNLPKDEIMVWMDFAENFSCTSQEEVQSAYWTTDMISLHTMVVYSESEVQSYVAISDVLTHNASVVYCIIQKFVPLLKEKYPDLKKIHYLTDSPTSQYRNKTVFEILCHHNSDFGVSARWNYLEVGHGKGPCDGLGGSVKRCADLAVRQRKCSIQDASQFFNWATSNNVSKVKYILYTAEDVEHAEAIIGEKPTAFTIQGTMKVHAVVPIDKFTVAIRELSCYCCECMANVTTTHCSGWSLKQIIKKPVEEEPARSTESESAQNSKISLAEKNGSYDKDSWVAALYQMEWYIGQITDIDEDDVLINFLTKSGKKADIYIYPLCRDEIWVHKSQVLHVIENIQATGKSKRSFKLSETDKMKIEAALKEF